MALGTFISVGRSLDQASARAARAEELGYESAYVTHIAGLDSQAVLFAYAARTERIRLGTGVMPIYSRTPVATAQIAAALDEFSGGRAIVGLGVSHRPVVEGWYGQEIGKPVREMREYAETTRAILRCEDPPADNERWRTGFHFMGVEPRPELPIYIAALSPSMLRLAGRIADGVILWLCTPNYIRDVVVPEVTTGRERAGKPLEGFDIVAAVPCGLTDDPDAIRARQRKELIPYFSLPFYRAMLERSGYDADVAAFDEKGPDGIGDDFISDLAGVGGADDVKRTISAYFDAGAVSPCVGGIGGADFDGTLEAAAVLTS